MSRQDILKIIQEIKPYLASRFHVSEIGLFGSFAKNDDTLLSDIDLLYILDEEKGDNISIFDLVDMKSYLENKLSRSVDIVEQRNIKPLLKKEILRSAIMI